jgi:hypothetical protein
MDFATIVNGVKQLVRRVDFVDFGNGGFRSRLKPGTLTADNDLTLPIGPGTIALTNAKTEAIAAQTATGLIKSTGANTASIVSTSTTIDNLLGAADQTAARGAIGLGTLATQNAVPAELIGITDWAVPALGSADLICDRLFGSVPVVTTGGTVTAFPAANLFFNEESYTVFQSGAALEIPVNGDTTYSDGYFLIHGYATPATAGSYPRPATVKIELYRNDTATWATEVNTTAWPADNRNLFIVKTAGALFFTGKVRITFTGANYWLTKIRWIVTRSNTNQALHKDDTRLQQLKGALALPSLQFVGGATQTASLRGTKTIGTASTTDTIAVTGAAVGDIARVSRGKDAYVSAPNTVTFDSTGLAGVAVSAIVGRFT